MNQVHDTSAVLEKVRQIVALVGSTAGPYGGNVQFFNGEGGPTYRDGLQVLKHYQPVQDDMLNNLVIRMRERANQVRRAAGDATTTTTILIGAFYEAGLAMQGKYSSREVGSRLRRFSEQVCAALDRMAIQVTDDPVGFDILCKVATMSAGNDPVIGEMAAKLIRDIGADGMVDLGYDANIASITCEKMEGMVLKGGAWHENFVGGANGKTVIENPYVLVLDEAKDWSALIPIMTAWTMAAQQDGRPLVVVCGSLEGTARDTLVKRQSPNGQILPVYCVRGGNDDVLQDLLSVVGGKSLLKKRGNMLADFKGVDDFGSAEKVVIDMGRSVIVGKDYEGIESRKSELLALIDAAQDEERKEALRARLANMEGRVGVIRIPVSTTGETNWRKEVVEDSYMAAQAALREGVLPGCGLSIMRAGYLADDSLVFKFSTESLFIKLLDNGGILPTSILDLRNFFLEQNQHAVLVLDEGALPFLRTADTEHLNYGDAVDLGILDSLTAVKAAVHHAAAEAAEWLETKHIVLPYNPNA